jgi:hypothetical protein
MAYVPTRPDATPCAADAAARFSTATGQPVTAVDTLVALLDSMLCSVGYQAHSDAFALGAATTTSTTFVDVGNGSSTGFSPWTFSVPVAKTYVISVNASAVKTASTSSTVLTFQLLVDGVAQPAQSDMLTWFAANFDQKHVIFSVPVALSAGSHTVKLQWKVSASMTASVDPATEGRHFMVTG